MWAIQLVGFMLLGLGVVIAAVFALPYLITKSLGHDQATCDCWDCKNRRARAVKKYRDRYPGTQVVGRDDDPMDPKNFWSTRELRSGYHVMIKSEVWQVQLLLAQPDGSVNVHLQNVLTRTTSVVPIQNRDIKIWRKGVDSWLS